MGCWERIVLINESIPWMKLIQPKSSSWGLLGDGLGRSEVWWLVLQEWVTPFSLAKSLRRQRSKRE